MGGPCQTADVLSVQFDDVGARFIGLVRSWQTPLLSFFWVIQLPGRGNPRKAATHNLLLRRLNSFLLSGVSGVLASFSHVRRCVLARFTSRFLSCHFMFLGFSVWMSASIVYLSAATATLRRYPERQG